MIPSLRKGNDEKQPKLHTQKIRKIDYFIPQRWVTIVTSFLVLFTAASMRYCLSITLTSMVKQVNNEGKFVDDTCSNHDNMTLISRNSNVTSQAVELFDWNEETQGIILSSFFWTNFVSSIVGGIVVQKISGKATFAFGILSMSVLTLLTPLSIEWGGSTGLICARALTGIGDGLLIPSSTMIMARWIPIHERSKAGAILFSGISLGSMFSMITSGLILQNFQSGWPITFYVFGGTGVFSFLLTCLFVYDQPNDSPFIFEAEIEYLNQHLSDTTTNPTAAPWRKILTSKSVWALIIVHTGIQWHFNIINLDIPKYMSGVLKFSVEETGYFTSIGGLANWIMGLIASFAFDSCIFKKTMRVTRVRKIGATFAALCPGFFLLASSYAGCNRLIFLVFYITAYAFTGCTICSVLVNPVDLTPKYAGALMGLVHGTGVLCAIIAPYVIGILTPNQTISEWNVIFWSIIVIGTSTSVIYMIFGSGNVQEWNDSISTTSTDECLAEYPAKRSDDSHSSSN
ncbi:hypothetical protein QAD02_019167 [Eretmocerus hayati]|uniref:Uncharacterized protein n=1 Tax=Eretmocerus hayati TaxID=131215 RepID=A0ACC2PIX5_9HYME|nr:hypothetical protein QAD02_019167 [Eretmocerus hayati]